VLQLVFSYQESQAALIALQREKAVGAAGRIQAFIGEIEPLVAGAVASPTTADVMPPEQRRTDFLRLLRQAPAVLEERLL
jgi:hypothetical protein